MVDFTLEAWGAAPPAPCTAAVGSALPWPASVILPPLSMDLGLLLISIGVVNLWRARQAD